MKRRVESLLGWKERISSEGDGGNRMETPWRWLVLCTLMCPCVMYLSPVTIGRFRTMDRGHGTVVRLVLVWRLSCVYSNLTQALPPLILPSNLTISSWDLGCKRRRARHKPTVSTVSPLTSTGFTLDGPIRTVRTTMTHDRRNSVPTCHQRERNWLATNGACDLLLPQPDAKQLRARLSAHG
jgi:hypothetical protein